MHTHLAFPDPAGGGPRPAFPFLERVAEGPAVSGKLEEVMRCGSAGWSVST